MEKGEKYLRIRVEGHEGYLKAYFNDKKQTDNEPDYKGKAIACWIATATGKSMGKQSEVARQNVTVPATRL